MSTSALPKSPRVARTSTLHARWDAARARRGERGTFGGDPAVTARRSLLLLGVSLAAGMVVPAVAHLL